MGILCRQLDEKRMRYLSAHRFSIMAILTLLCLSCNYQSQYYYPSEVGSLTGRETHPRFEGVMDSTIAGVPTVVGSEWVYVSSYFVSPSSWYHDTVRIRLTSVDWNSINGYTYTYQEFKGTMTHTFNLIVRGDTLYCGYNFWADTVFGIDLWGSFLTYQFPLTVGKLWFYSISRIEVIRKEMITVKAGAFYTYVIKSGTRVPPWENSYRWYSPDVGIIAYSYSDTVAKFIINAELLSYHIGPKRR